MSMKEKSFEGAQGPFESRPRRRSLLPFGVVHGELVADAGRKSAAGTTDDPVGTAR